MLKSSLHILLFFIGSFHISGYSQTPRQVIIEHFTNTRCSICASKNPAFYALLRDSYPGVLHIAYHPSAPYSNCLFNQQNVVENDARTNYYGVYGSTPRAVIQGNIVPIQTPLISSSTIDAQLNQLSPFEVSLTLREGSLDVVEARLVVRATAPHSHSTLNLFAAVTEDTVFYAAPNGENLHFDVFRQQLFVPGNNTITPPANMGDSAVFVTTFNVNSNWVKPQVSVIAMLQEPAGKEVVQAARQSFIENMQEPVALQEPDELLALHLFPNPAQHELHWSNATVEEVRLYNSNGKLMAEQNVSTPSISLNGIPDGIYFIHLSTAAGDIVVKRFVIAR